MLVFLERACVRAHMQQQGFTRPYKRLFDMSPFHVGVGMIPCNRMIPCLKKTWGSGDNCHP